MNEFLTIVSSGAFAALVTGVLNVRNTNKTVHAQVVAKARHDWIQEVRNLMSEYLSEIEDIKYNINREYQTNENSFSIPVINQNNNKFKSLSILKIKFLCTLAKLRHIEHGGFRKTKKIKIIYILTNLWIK